MSDAISLSRADLEALAMQMDSGMIVGPVLAKDLRELIAKAKPAADPALLAEAVLEIRAFGHCRQKVHDETVCECRHCVVLRKAAA